MKKLISILTVLAMISGIFALSAYAEKDGSGETADHVIQLPDDALDDSDFVIRIVHTNDIHARIEENEKSGIIGAEKLKTLIDGFTSDCDISLVLDSGDIYHGLSIATVCRGESAAEVVKELGYDAVSAGSAALLLSKGKKSRI